MPLLLAERIGRARELLAGTTISMQDVAGAGGFGTLATLRYHFRRSLGISSSAYRAKFATVPSAYSKILSVRV